MVYAHIIEIGSSDIKVKGNSLNRDGELYDTYEIVNPPFV